MASASPRKFESKCGKLLVAAIDFGTTYSGYAFSFKSDYESDPTKISTPSTLAAGTNALMSLKTPTTLLLNKDGSFKAFGFDAEDTYSDLAAEDMHQDYYFFRHFKKKVFDKASSTGLKRHMEIPDDKGNMMEALLVFGMSIKYLKEHLLKTVKSRGTDIRESDIRWVLTVPASWIDGSKQFMREAAEVAGITGSNLMIALEPEAASLYCMHLPVEKLQGSSDGEQTKFSKGTKYMVVDVGDETVDMTTYEVVDDNKLKEINLARGSDCGNANVNEAFTQFILKIVGRDVFEKFEEDHKGDWVSLYREFETKERNIKLDNDKKETLRIPAKLIYKYQEMKDKPFKTAVAELEECKGQITTQGDKLRMNSDIMIGFFKEACDNTVKHVQDLLKEKSCKGIKILVLVGGLAESPLLQEAIISHFPDLRVIIPADFGLTVLKGAVLFGHNPTTIVSRIAKLSYGVRAYLKFQESVYPPNKRVQIGKKVKCKDIFAAHVKKGQELKVGEPQSSQRYKPLEAEQMTLVFDIFTSTEENPQFVTDVSCQYIGQLEVEVPDTSAVSNREVSVIMFYGGTELIVEAVEESTHISKKATFDFLN